MRTLVFLTLACLLIESVLFVGRSNADYMGSPPKPPKTLVTFKAMYPVAGPFVAAAIRGVPGDGLPWAIQKASGRLDANGHLVVNVKGLVFTNDNVVPPELRGINDETEFRGLVSCLTVSNGAVVEQNVVSAGVPASPRGSSKINVRLTLPNPCVAPIVMVLSGSDDFWFAVGGGSFAP